MHYQDCVNQSTLIPADMKKTIPRLMSLSTRRALRTKQLERVITTAAGIMSYLLLQPCGMETEFDGDNNEVRNQQKVDILSPNLAINGGDTCDIWNSYGFKAFEDS